MVTPTTPPLSYLTHPIEFGVWQLIFIILAIFFKLATKEKRGCAYYSTQDKLILKVPSYFFPLGIQNINNTKS